MLINYCTCFFFICEKINFRKVHLQTNRLALVSVYFLIFLKYLLFILFYFIRNKQNRLNIHRCTTYRCLCRCNITKASSTLSSSIRWVDWRHTIRRRERRWWWTRHRRWRHLAQLRCRINTNRIRFRNNLIKYIRYNFFFFFFLFACSSIVVTFELLLRCDPCRVVIYCHVVLHSNFVRTIVSIFEFKFDFFLKK